MKQVWKRTMSLALSGVLLLSNVPVQALAAEETAVQEKTVAEAVTHEAAGTAEAYDHPTTMYVANVENSIYLRSAPVEEDGNIITTIPVGTQVVWLENTNTVFSKVSYSTMTGYVKRDYLSARDPKQNIVPAGNNVVSRYVYVTNVKNSIYLRSTAAERPDNVITTIPVGTQVGYIESVNNVFSKIKYNGVIGYAKTIYLADYYDSGYEYLVVCNVKNSIYLRSEPRENSNNIICEIPLGDIVCYLGNAGNGFYKISYNGYVGYSKSAYLR
jgi:hypothetical protein